MLFEGDIEGKDDGEEAPSSELLPVANIPLSFPREMPLLSSTP